VKRSVVFLLSFSDFVFRLSLSYYYCYYSSFLVWNRVFKCNVTEYRGFTADAVARVGTDITYAIH